ncbi:MAG: 3-deoxy-manno-octulosonate cytidylyltransferase [Candidatus Aminicenantes bacterium]
MKSAAGIIPARYRSTRFPGKPLAPILGKPMVQHVYERARQARGLQRLIIATDDKRIFSAARNFGAEAMMTSSGHISGTERAAEAADSIPCDILINIQGDEPLLNPDWVDKLVQTLQDESIPAATLRRRGCGPESYLDTNCVKIIIDKNDNALYFSRAPIPYDSHSEYWIHIGIYGFQKDFLKTFTRFPPSYLEKKERLEQLRILENGYPIKTVETSDAGLSVDTPQDIIKVEKLLKTDLKKNE